MVINMLTIAGNLALWVLFLLDKREVRFIWGLTWSGPDSRSTLSVCSSVFHAVYRKSSDFQLSQTILQIPSSLFLLLRCSGCHCFLCLSAFSSSFPPFSEKNMDGVTFLQPILQEHFGMRKGVLILGVFWGLWHLPLNLFYYAPDTRLQSIAAQLITCIALSVFFAFAYIENRQHLDPCHPAFYEQQYCRTDQWRHCFRSCHRMESGFDTSYFL